MSKINLIVIALVAVISGIVGYKLAPSSPVVTAESEQQSNNNVVTVIKEVTKPNGEIVKETVVTDKTKQVITAKKTELPAPPKYLVAAAYNINKQDYQFTAGYSVLKNAYITASYNTSGSVLIGLTVLF